MMLETVSIAREAVISPCGIYRYALSRRWQAEGPYALFIGLNPGVADAEVDDVITNKYMSFAKNWGCSAVYVGNLFAYRTTNFDQIRQTPDPVGPLNNSTLLELSQNAWIIVASWGYLGNYLGRDMQVREMIPNLHYLRRNSKGYPEQAYYLPLCIEPKLWEQK